MDVAFQSCLLYCEVNVICFLLCSIIWYRVTFKNSSADFIRNMFSAFVFLNMLTFIFDVCAFLFEQYDSSVMSSVSQLYHSLYCVFWVISLYVWFLYSSFIQKNFFSKAIWKTVISGIPCLVVVYLCLSTNIDSVVFFMDGDKLIKGPLFSIVFYVCGVYLLCTAGFSAFYLTKKRKYILRHVLIRLFFYSLMLFSCFYLQKDLISKVPVTCLITTLVIFMIHLTYLDGKVTVDVLTQVSIRSVFEKDLVQLLRCCSRENEVYLMIVDIDGFRKINNTYGHSVGDETLLLTANALRNNVLEGSLLCRFSSDLFAVAVELSCDYDILEMKQKIEKAVEKINRIDALPFYLSVTMGIASSAEYGLNVCDLIKGARNSLMINKKNK